MEWWARSMLPYGVTRPQWVNLLPCSNLNLTSVIMVHAWCKTKSLTDIMIMQEIDTVTVDDLNLPQVIAK